MLSAFTHGFYSSFSEKSFPLPGPWTLSQVQGFYYKTKHQNRICHPEPRSGWLNLWDGLGRTEKVNAQGEGRHFFSLWAVLYNLIPALDFPSQCSCLSASSPGSCVWKWVFGTDICRGSCIFPTFFTRKYLLVMPSAGQSVCPLSLVP